MADDFAGLKQTISDFFNAVPVDKAIVHMNESQAQTLRQLFAVFKQKAAANGVILP